MSAAEARCMGCKYIFEWLHIKKKYKRGSTNHSQLFQALQQQQAKDHTIAMATNRTERIRISSTGAESTLRKRPSTIEVRSIVGNVYVKCTAGASQASLIVLTPRMDYLGGFQDFEIVHSASSSSANCLVSLARHSKYRRPKGRSPFEIERRLMKDYRIQYNSSQLTASASIGCLTCDKIAHQTLDVSQRLATARHNHARTPHLTPSKRTRNTQYAHAARNIQLD